MKPSEAIAELNSVMRRERKSEKTRENYVGWMRRFFEWISKEKANGRTYQLGDGSVDIEARCTAYLSIIAPKVSASTQTQCLCALVYFHREVMQRPLGQLPDWVSAKRPKRLPEWVTPSEAMAIFDRMTGIPLLMAQLQFGAGLRLREVVALRIKDLRLKEGTIMVRGGKGDKDRVTILPTSLISSIRDNIRRSEQLWNDDRRDNIPGVYLPDDVARKAPNHGSRWEWHWLFPSHKLSTDTVTGITRRHHYHPDNLNKSVTIACSKARLGRRVTSHAFRHGFATALIASGRPIQEVSQLMGHSSIETTQIYLHCLPRIEERLTSPLDIIQNVTPIRRVA